MTTQRTDPAGGTEGPPLRKGLWERLFDSWWIPVFVLPMVVGIVLNVFGIPSGMTMGAIPTLAVVLVLMWARNKQRRKRLALVAVRDRSFECWLRYPNALRDSLRHRWAYGTCRLEAGTLTFQPMGGVDEQPMGRPSAFTGLSRLGEREIPASERRGATRSWQGVALSTEQGEIELLCPVEADLVLSDIGGPDGSRS